jgi:hypothetical protein
VRLTIRDGGMDGYVGECLRARMCACTSERVGPIQLLHAVPGGAGWGGCGSDCSPTCRADFVFWLVSSSSHSAASNCAPSEAAAEVGLALPLLVVALASVASAPVASVAGPPASGPDVLPVNPRRDVAHRPFCTTGTRCTATKAFGTVATPRANAEQAPCTGRDVIRADLPTTVVHMTATPLAADILCGRTWFVCGPGPCRACASPRT